MGVESQKLIKACQSARKNLNDNMDGPAHQLKSLGSAVARLAQKIRKNPDPKSWSGDNASVVTERTFARNSLETLFAKNLATAVKAAAELDGKVKKKAGWRSFFTEQKDLPAAQAELKLIQGVINVAKGKQTKYTQELAQLEKEAEEVLSGVPKVDPKLEAVRKIAVVQVKKLVPALATVKAMRPPTAAAYEEEVFQLVRGVAANIGKIPEWAAFRTDWAKLASGDFMKGVADGDPVKEKLKKIEEELKEFLPHLED
jgi:hypothetical protein